MDAGLSMDYGRRIPGLIGILTYGFMIYILGFVTGNQYFGFGPMNQIERAGQNGRFPGLSGWVR